MDDFIIADKNPSKHMHDIDMHFWVREITDSTNYYLENKFVRVGNCSNVSLKKYVNEILCKYKKTHGNTKNKLLTMKVKGHPALDYYLFLNEK